MSKLNNVTVEWVEEEGMSGWYECVSDGVSHLYTLAFHGFGPQDHVELQEYLEDVYPSRKIVIMP